MSDTLAYIRRALTVSYSLTVSLRTGSMPKERSYHAHRYDPRREERFDLKKKRPREYDQSRPSFNGPSLIFHDIFPSIRNVRDLKQICQRYISYKDEAKETLKRIEDRSQDGSDRRHDEVARHMVYFGQMKRIINLNDLTSIFRSIMKEDTNCKAVSHYLMAINRVYASHDIQALDRAVEDAIKRDTLIRESMKALNITKDVHDLREIMPYVEPEQDEEDRPSTPGTFDVAPTLCSSDVEEFL